MAARLKVFVTSDGLTDYVVAETSRPKALAAWGVRQDLFKEGKAHETEDERLRDAALAAPGQVLRKPSDSRGVLAKLKPVARPKPKSPSKAALKKVTELEKKQAAAKAALSKGERRIEAARGELRAAETALESLAAARDRIETELARAREGLED